MKLFWRDSADYNLILDKILDYKYFSSNSKSLMLSMIYKIENYFSDYKKVKNIDVTKEEFLNLIVDTIKKYCDNIKLIEPNEDDGLKKNNVLALTNEKERSLLCYPTEMSLLYGISDIMPKYFYIKKEFEYRDALQRTLVNGYNANFLEVLSDFNGWSWYSNSKNKKNIQDNLIYQNLVIMFGNSYLEEWKSNNKNNIDYLNEVKKFFSNTEFFNYLCKYLVFGLSKNELEKNNKELNLKIKELEEMSDKMAYFEKIKIKKLRYIKELEKITIVLNNKELMKKEYLKKNLKLSQEKKIESLGNYKKILEKRKETIINEIAKLSFCMNPINYMNKKRELEKIIKLDLETKDNKDEIVIKLQEEFIKSLKEICYETEDKDSLKNLLYKIRYYRFLYINDDFQIRDIENLNKNINELLKQLIRKLIIYENVKKISNNEFLNLEIILNILDTKVIDLMSLRFEIDIKEDSILVKTYEKEAFEKEFEIYGSYNKKSFEIKQNKIYKLFI